LVAPGEQGPVHTQLLATQRCDLLGGVGVIEPQCDALHGLTEAGQILGQRQRHENIRRHRHLRCLVNADDHRFLGQHDLLESFERLAIHLLDIRGVDCGDGLGDFRLRFRIEEKHAGRLVLLAGFHGDKEFLDEFELRRAQLLGSQVFDFLIDISQRGDVHGALVTGGFPRGGQSGGGGVPVGGKCLAQRWFLGRFVGAHDFLEIARRVEADGVAHTQRKLLGEDRGNDGPVVDAEIGGGFRVVFDVEHFGDALDLRWVRSIDAAEHDRPLP